MKEFLPDTGNEVSPKINRDSFSSFNELRLELSQLLKAIKECPIECNIIYDILKNRIKKICEYMSYLETKIVPPNKQPSPCRKC